MKLKSVYCIRGDSQQGLDVDAISQRSGALTGCGGCEWDVAELVKALQKSSA
jgi:NAD(P)H-nitrite reductase large subunit